MKTATVISIALLTGLSAVVWSSQASAQSGGKDGGCAILENGARFPLSVRLPQSIWNVDTLRAAKTGHLHVLTTENRLSGSMTCAVTVVITSDNMCSLNECLPVRTSELCRILKKA